MQAELEALTLNNTWIVTSLPPNKHAIGYRWIYKIEYHAYGNIERYKARLVAKGYTQMEGLDYIATFSPMAKLTTLDVNNVFLHGELDEEVYMTLSLGINPSFPNQHGYKQSASDHSLFLKISESSTTAILVYVDDIVLTGNNISEIESFLGLEVARNSTGIHLSQRKYTLDILTDCGMLASRPVATPMDDTDKLSTSSGTPLPDPSSYHRLLGRLIYLTTTRPDISYVVHHLSQFMSAPTSTHSQAAFSDSDWAGFLDTRYSVTGFSVYLGDSLVSWRSKKQPIVSRSSLEAEYRALATTTCELQCVPRAHKHIDIDCHLVREKFQSGSMKLLPVSSSQQLTDIFTKSLSPSLFSTLHIKLGMFNLYSQLEGEGGLNRN
ncbi:hypothetical protein V8G54_018035 [Vigna mungo]|uniref:Reverse transcriptase Ty1/copia-type domain-containing protein n=1 Tax=Vigna mungo TaxID=3915 RepID=A0AAQ3RR36_VIGMU